MWNSLKYSFVFCKNAMSESTAALQALYIRLQWKKALASMSSVLWIVTPSNWKSSVGKGQTGTHWAAHLQFFQWGIELIGYQCIQMMLLTIRGLGKDAECIRAETDCAVAGCLTHCWKRALAFSGLLARAQSGRYKVTALTSTPMAACLLGSSLPPPLFSLLFPHCRPTDS